MADHEHVEMLVHGVHGIGPRRVRGGRQHVLCAASLDDVGRVAAARAFGVIRVDRAILEGGDGVLDKAGFVQGVGMNRDLNVELLRHA
jgi:hypothetical protein